MIQLTWYRHALSAHRGLRMSLEADELAFAISDAGPHHGPKGDLPLICTATFKGDHRKNVNVEGVHMLGLDIDTPTADPAARIEAISEALGGVEVFAYSTHSSLPDAFKLRALVPYDRAASGDEHRASWSLVARVLARKGIVIDRACCDPARGFYVWSVPPSGAYFYQHTDGEPWPVAYAAEVESARIAELERLHTEAAARRAASRPASSLAIVERARRYVATMPAAISGSGGHTATFAVARKLVADFELAESDAWQLLLEFNDRCLPPWSEKDLRRKLAQASKARVRTRMVSQ